MTEIDVIADRLDVCEALYRWFLAIDRKNWDDCRVSLVDRIDADAPKSLGIRQTGLDTIAFVARVRDRYAPVLTMHQCTNESLVVVADRAEVDFLVTAHFHRASDRGSADCKAMIRGAYVLLRRGHDWLIAGVSETVRWIEGNPGLLDLSHRPPAGPSSAPAAPRSSSAPPRSQAERLRLIEDRLAIGDVMTRFGEGLDRKDWDLYRSCFLDRFTVDFSAVTGRAPVEVDARDWAEFARLRQRTQIAHHQYSNLQVAVDGERGRAVLYLIARHHAPGDYGSAENAHVGWYDNDFVRTGSGWKIGTLRHPLQWIDGNEMIKDTPDPDVTAITRKIFGG